jgi:hypothetical protein
MAYRELEYEYRHFYYPWFRRFISRTDLAPWRKMADPYAEIARESKSCGEHTLFTVYQITYEYITERLKNYIQQKQHSLSI